MQPRHTGHIPFHLETSDLRLDLPTCHQPRTENQSIGPCRSSIARTTNLPIDSSLPPPPRINLICIRAEVSYPINLAQGRTRPLLLLGQQNKLHHGMSEMMGLRIGREAGGFIGNFKDSLLFYFCRTDLPVRRSKVRSPAWES